MHGITWRSASFTATAGRRRTPHLPLSTRCSFCLKAGAAEVVHPASQGVPSLYCMALGFLLGHEVSIVSGNLCRRVEVLDAVLGAVVEVPASEHHPLDR